MKRALLLAVAVALLLAGCGGGDDKASSTSTTTTTAPSLSTDGRVYWLRDEKVWPAARQLEAPAVAAAALEALYDGPSADEERELGAATAIPEGYEVPQVTIEDRVAHVSPVDELPAGALAQVVYTLTQFSTVRSVEIAGKTYTRADFEDLTPLILVESPLPYERVTSPLRATGTANTFEATFDYELVDSDGKVVGKDFVTATSGTGTRGTFDFTVPFEISHSGLGKLVVFELSANDGSRINEVDIPLRMET